MTISASRGAAWSTSTATEAVGLAWSAYCPLSEVSSWDCYWCEQTGTPQLTSVQTAYSKSWDNFAYGGIDSGAKTIYIVFRGTAVRSVKDILEDADLIQTKPWKNLPKVKVHSGFWRAYGTLAAQVKSIISELKSSCTDCKLVLVGHSLGGAMATLASVDLSKSGLKVNQLITLGSPRVGNGDFATYFAGRRIPHVRWVNKGDLVPHVPSGHGYRHTTQEYWSKDGKSFTKCDATNGEDKHCSDGLHRWLIQYSLKDHLKYFNVNLGDGKARHCDGVYDNKS